MTTYTGLSSCDLERFTVSQFELIKGKNYIRGNRRKTNTEYFLPLLPEAEQILRKYDYKIPLLTNQKANEFIKVGMNHAGIYKRMKFHSSRKTFANYCLNHLLYSKETTAKMMGQSSLKEIQAYANTTDLRVINETNKKGLKLPLSGWLRRLLRIRPTYSQS